jgi:periplasmic protein CpxP/Spy
MNKLRFLTWTVILLLLLNAGTLIYLLTTRNQDQRPPHGDPAPDFITEQLQLDAQQQLRFAELRHQHQEIVRRIQEQDRKLHDEYFNLLKTDNPDRVKADSISLLIGKQRSSIEAATFEHFQQLRRMCNDEQKKLFDATIDEIMKRMAPKGPPPGGPPPPR